MTEPATSNADHARFNAIFRATERLVLAYALRRCANPADAEDVVVETFTVAWRRIDKVPDDPVPWLYAVARRVMSNRRRGDGRRDRLISLLRQSDVATPVHLGVDRDGPAFEALAALSPADQELLRLVAWEELRNHQVADVLAITPNAVAIRLHRARARFVAALDARTVGKVKHLDPFRTLEKVKGTDRAALKGEAK